MTLQSRRCTPLPSSTVAKWVLLTPLTILALVGGGRSEGDDPSKLGRVEAFEASLATASSSNDSPTDSQDVESQTHVPSPSQLARSQGHWWETESTLTIVLMEAEEEFLRNLQREEEVRGKGNPPWARDSPPPGAPPGPSPFTYMDRRFIATYPCPYEARLGAWGDGGKWICLSHYKSRNPRTVVLSVGSNGDTSFEKAIFQTLGVATYTLDFSLRPETAEEVQRLEYVNFFPVGVSGSGEMEMYTARFQQWGSKFLTFPQVLKLIQQEYVDIFKVDCENCEYDLVRDLGRLYTKDTVPIGQIQVELHRCSNISATEEIFNTLEWLGFRLFHTEINLYGAGFNNWQYEVSLIHESIVFPKVASL